MLESYCADIERMLRDGALRPALRLSVALPDICAALEDTLMKSSRERYVAWCETWLVCAIGTEPLEAGRLYHLYSGSGRIRRGPGPPDDPTAAALSRLRIARQARREKALARLRVWYPANRLQTFQVTLTEALVDASRRWYQQTGAGSAVVQRNLGRLRISG